jgi:hypothetical protein
MNARTPERGAGLGVGRVELERVGEPGPRFAFAAQRAADSSDLIEAVESGMIRFDTGGQDGEVLEATMVRQGLVRLIDPAGRAEGLGQSVPYLRLARGQPDRLSVSRYRLVGFSLEAQPVPAASLEVR